MAARRLKLAMDRGELPFREGQSMYINKVEMQVLIRTAAGNLTNAGRLYIARGGSENSTKLFAPDTVPWNQGRNGMAYAAPDRYGAGRAFRIHGGAPNGPTALTNAGRLYAGHKVLSYLVHMPVWVRYYDSVANRWRGPFETDGRGDPITIPLDEEELSKGNGAQIPHPELFDIRDGYHDAGEETVQRDIKDAVTRYLAAKGAEQGHGPAGAVPVHDAG